MRIRIVAIFLILFGFTYQLIAQKNTQYNDFALSDFKLEHHLLIGSIAGKRVDKLNHKLAVHYLGNLAYQKHAIGIGVGFENEDYFYVMPAYLHYSYQLWKNVKLPKPYTEIGLAFNREKDIFLANSFSGILVAGGFMQSFKISKRTFLQLKIGYRYQETSTVLLSPSWGTGQGTETLIKHKMHRINAMVGIKL